MFSILYALISRQDIPVVSVTSPSDIKKLPLSVSDVYSDKPQERKSDEVARNQAQNIPPKPTGFSAAISAIKRSGFEFLNHVFIFPVSSPTLVNEANASPRSDNGKANALGMLYILRNNMKTEQVK